MSEQRYPRMLFRGDETSRADTRDELLAKRAQGWRARLLPGETPEDIGEAEAPPAPPPSTPYPGTRPEDNVDALPAPKRGRPPKAVG